MYIQDITFENSFYEEWETADVRAKKAFDKIIKLIARSGKFPKSFHPHKEHALGEYWIGYVTVGRCGWRVLYTHEDSVVNFCHLISHQEMEEFFR